MSSRGRSVGGILGSILIVEDDAAFRFGLASVLRKTGYEVLEAETCADALRTVTTAKPNVVLLDLQLRDGLAFDTLSRMRAVAPSLPIFVVTGHGSIETAVLAVKHGADDFLTKPVSAAAIQTMLEGAFERLRRVRMGEESQPELRDKHELPSPAMQEIGRQIERLRDADCPVLILGETGTGKSVLARRIHAIGTRRTKPFVDVNCAGWTRDLVESELFGHERGAFTGAHATKVGLFDAADGGTLFLDEIGDIDIQVQPKILKVIEDNRYRRVGDTRERNANVRLIAATHHNLTEDVALRTFRADLYYRISTVTLTVPPLRDRRDDVLPIAQRLLNARPENAHVQLSPGARQMLLGHRWPGNVRELKNVIERALLLRDGDILQAEDLRFDNRSPSAAKVTSAMRIRAITDADMNRRDAEVEQILSALEAEQGRVEAAAKRLGVPRSTLYWKIKAYGIRASSPPGAAVTRRWKG